MESKLLVNFSTGQLEVTGSEDLIREVYSDFKNQLGKTRTATVPQSQNDEVGTSTKTPPKKPSKARKSGGTGNVNPDLDTTGLENYFGQYDIKKDAERALVFAIFLRDEKKNSDIDADAIYTCFFALKDQLKLPNIDGLINNDTTRTKFFSRGENGELVVTRIGENHFAQKLKARVD